MLREGKVGCKLWWNVINETQGNTRDETVPPLVTQDGTTSNTKEKADVLARHSSNKMSHNQHTRG